MKSNKNNIQLSKPYLDEEDLESVREVFGTGYLGMGANVEKFEDLLRHYFNREVVCVSSGTSALHLALNALGVKSGDEIIVQSLTYSATFQAIAAAGAIPISCDICEEDLTIDLDDARKKLTSRTKAIIPVHYTGNASKLEEVLKFAHKYNIRVIEDAAHAFGSKYNEHLVGSIGDITCFSFDPVKNMTCGEGGAVVTNEKKL